MTKRHAILQKKLQELESELTDFFCLPTETPCHQLLSDDIEQRFLFLNNLLSAEISSNPSKPHHLLQISQKLNELENNFRNWDPVAKNSETGSTCSCTPSFLNDNGEGVSDMGSPVYEVPETYFEEMTKENVSVLPDEIVKVLSDEREVEKEESRVRVWRYFRVMGSGVMVGAVLMGLVIVRFSGCFFNYIEHESEGFLTPT